MKTSRTAAIVLGAVALGSIGFVGCGSSDTPATTAAATADGANAEPRLTAEEYRAAADAVCAETDATIEALPEPSESSAIKAYIADSAAAVQAGAEGLSGLYPPADLEAAHKRLVEVALNSAEFANGIAAGLPDAPTDAEVTAASEQLQGADAEAFVAEQKAAAAELGLTECGSDDSDSTGDDSVE